MNHIMIDLETLATTSDAAVVQIGAVPFKMEGDGLLADGICINVDPDACLAAGLRIEWGTLQWWMNQSQEARATLPGQGEGLKLSAAMKLLGGYIRQWGGEYCKVWANGAAFDIPIIENCFRVCREPVPWKFYNVLDVRTMRMLCPNVERVKPNVAHNAMPRLRLCGFNGWGPPPGRRRGSSPQCCSNKRRITGMSEELKPLGEFWEELRIHDWTYSMSDDPNVYRRGAREELRLLGISRQSQAHRELYDAWKKYLVRRFPA